MATTTRGYRYPASTDAPNVPLDLQRLAEDVDDDVSALHADTGWVTPTIDAAWDTYSTIECRNVGGVVHLRGYVRPDSGAVSAGLTAGIATLPAGSRPDAQVYISAVRWVAGGSPEYGGDATVRVATDGVLSVYVPDATTGVMVDGLVFLVD